MLIKDLRNAASSAANLARAPLGPSRAGRAWLVALALAASPRSATAGEIPTVTLTQAGPDQEMPLGSSFYIAGTLGAPSVDKVHLVFVRHSYGALGSNVHLYERPDNCAAVRSALSTIRGDVFSPPRSGVVNIGEIWSPPANGTVADRTNYQGLRDGHAALVVPPWERAPGTKDNEFKILIPKSEFFRPSARYCLLGYEISKLPKRDGEIRKALSRFGLEWPACEAKATEEERAACQKDTLARLDEAVGKAVKGLNEDARKKAVETVRAELFPTAEHLANAPRRVAQLARRWEDLAIKKYDFPDYRPIATDPLAGLAVALLARHGRGIQSFPDPAAKRIRFFTDDVQISVNHLGLFDTFDRARVAADLTPGKPGKHPPIPFDPKTVFLPDSNVSFLDVLQLSQGKVLAGGAYVPMKEIPDRVLRPALEAGSGSVPTEDKLMEIAALHDWLDRVHAALVRAWKARAEQAAAGASAPPPPDLSAQFIYASLGRWLDQVLGPCSDDLRRAAADRRAPSCSAGVSAVAPTWPGYDTPRENPLGYVVVQLASYLESARTWTQKTAELAEHLKQLSSTPLRTATIDLRVGVTAETWVFHYLTPTVGWSHLSALPGAVWINYLGVQLYLWPNPVDEPMWSNGWSDVNRLFGLEVGVGLSKGPFGPEGRYGGLAGSNLPPIFAGLALQPLPYVTASAGASFLGKRSSTLTQETQDAYVSPYVGLSVQANIPDFVAAVRGRKVTVEPQ
ncbi:hypothetical protein predicted by Glimmer/Critica [Sorangium cellulosum So ce56]|uniref:Uncharacterized protein n=1 Tax=Sorangium cellulosum (strain So ce56) TaxID=448385 RepID=A9GJ66_SORC5|nr:hypothetical protein [Sorangium cellulosum]CAN93362.1 hypothetical protein predicted by Glimmer/Critica [Sorangium cellulosum So ce56]